MDKEKVLDYVMNSPGNSNRAVLSGMLDESGGGEDKIVYIDFEMDTIGFDTVYYSSLTIGEMITLLENNKILIGRIIHKGLGNSIEYIYLDTFQHVLNTEPGGPLWHIRFYKVNNYNDNQIRLLQYLCSTNNSDNNVFSEQSITIS